MPSIEYSHLFQRAVLWPKTGDSDYSEPTLGNRTEIACRWIEGIKEALDPNGNVITLTAWAEVDRDIEIGSLMWLGKAIDLVGTAAPAAGLGPLMQVVTFSKVPDARAREYAREVGLLKFRDSLPIN